MMLLQELIGGGKALRESEDGREGGR